MSVLSLPRNRSITLGTTSLIMGIINATPDSFYPGSRRSAVEEALGTARGMIRDGADILDIGGESTRPGSDYVDAADERERVIPVIESIREESDIAISVDTRKSIVAEAALDAGADIVNDVSALRDDPGLASLVVERGVPVVLMHMRGTPKTMQQNPEYQDTIAEIQRELGEFADAALDAGVRPEQIILDPGVGFGKTVSDNVRIVRHIDLFRTLEYPLLLGVSRKSFIGALCHGGERPVEQRLAGTLAVHAYAILHGAEILRVHDVRETADVRAVLTGLSGVDTE
jgi:dihydropteroate synthase